MTKVFAKVNVTPPEAYKWSRSALFYTCCYNPATLDRTRKKRSGDCADGEELKNSDVWVTSDPT